MKKKDVQLSRADFDLKAVKSSTGVSVMVGCFGGQGRPVIVYKTCNMQLHFMATLRLADVWSCHPALEQDITQTVT